MRLQTLRILLGGWLGEKNDALSAVVLEQGRRHATRAGDFLHPNHHRHARRRTPGFVHPPVTPDGAGAFIAMAAQRLTR